MNYLETAPSGKAYRSLEIYISFLERLTPQCGWIQVNEPILCTDMADRHWVFRPEMREKHNYRGVPDGIQWKIRKTPFELPADYNQPWFIIF